MALAGTVLLGACASGPSAPHLDPRLALFAGECSQPAPLHLAAGEKVPDGFIVVYHDSVTNVDALTTQLARQYGFTTVHRYESALKGFAATLKPDIVAALRCVGSVNYIGEDGIVRIG